MADLAQQLLDVANKGASDLNEADRSALLQATYKLSSALESPVEQIFRLCFTIYDPIAIRIGIDLKVFDIAVAHSGPISLDELAQQTKADPYFLQRLMRMLIHLDFFTQPTPQTFLPTPSASTLTSASPIPQAFIHFTHIYPSIAAMPAYFAGNNYKNPSDASDAPLNLGFNHTGTYFDLIGQPANERYATAFDATMQMQKSTSDAAFTQSGYPASERLASDDASRVLFVDVGGNTGHQAVKFAQQYADLKGKIVLQDLPDVVARAECPAEIERLGHDFFTPQPDSVRGARAYYMRTILHDWPQKQAEQILKNLVAVMAKDSVILLHENVLPEQGVPGLQARMDWHMMNLAALERTETQWKELAESVGLKVNGVWYEQAGFGKVGLIELGLK